MAESEKPSPGERRYTIRHIAAGQPKPYADTKHHVRVTMETVPYINETVWGPDPCTNEDVIRRMLVGLQCGFTEFTYPPKDRKPTESDYFATRLDWLRNPEPGVWEFQTTSKYTG